MTFAVLAVTETRKKATAKVRRTSQQAKPIKETAVVCMASIDERDEFSDACLVSAVIFEFLLQPAFLAP